MSVRRPSHKSFVCGLEREAALEGRWTAGRAKPHETGVLAAPGFSGKLVTIELFASRRELSSAPRSSWALV